MKPILCLDFDGVICNSIDETLLVTYNAYNRFKKSNAGEPLVAQISDVPSSITAFFKRYRYLVRPAGEYWLLMHLLDKQFPEDQINQEKFQSMVAEYASNITSFELFFFATRKEFQKTYLSQWLEFHKLYYQFAQAWVEINKLFNIYIVTTKNIEAVKLLLKHFSVAIPEDRIFSKESTKNKYEAIIQIARDNHIHAQQITFVDDHPLHLQDVVPSGAYCLWASWGYYSYCNHGQKQINSLLELTKK